MGRALKATSVIVFVMVIIILVITLPILYGELDKLSDLSVDQAMEYTGDLYYSTQQYLAHHRVDPPTHDLLVELHYLEPDSVLLMQWEFSIYWPDSIVAVSLNAMPGGRGQRLLYDIEQDEFYGFSLPSVGLPSTFR